MIKVKVFKSPTKTEFKETTDLLKSMSDDIIRSLELGHEKDLNKLTCENHPNNSKGTIFINLERQNNSYEFKDSPAILLLPYFINSCKSLSLLIT